MSTTTKSGSTTFISNFFSRENLRVNIHNLSYLPRWIIVMMDLVVLMTSFFFTYLIFRGTGLDYIITPHTVVFITVLFGVNIFFFWLFRTYSGIIRHSSYIDAVKLLFSQMAVLVLFLVLNFVFEIIVGYKAFLNTALFINMVLVFLWALLVSRNCKANFRTLFFGN